MSKLATFGQLECRVVPARKQVESVVVLCHGYGAPGTDLVPLAAELTAMDPGLCEGVQFVFPQAPLSLDSIGLPGGRAWWHLDVSAINEMIARGELRDLRDGFPDGATHARDLLLQTVTSLSEETGVPLSKFVLGGFSQGSMVATDVALRLPECPAGLCILSGTLVAEAEWRQLARSRGSMPVLQSHGRFDPILPYEGAVWLRDALVEEGLEVEFLDFDGVHTIPLEALHHLSSLLCQPE